MWGCGWVDGVGGLREAWDGGGWSVKFTGSCNLTTPIRHDLPNGLTPMHAVPSQHNTFYLPGSEVHESLRIITHDAYSKRENNRNHQSILLRSACYHVGFCQVSFYSDLVLWWFICV